MSIDILTLAAARAGKGGGSASKYKQPEWGVEENGVILPEVTLEVDPDAGMAVVTSPLNAPVINGEVYNVIFNGVEYPCTAVESDEGGGFVLGNGSMLGVETPNSDVPFFFLVSYEDTALQTGMYAVGVPIDGSASFTIAINAKITHKIPADYIDGGIYLINTQQGDSTESDSTFTLDINFSEILTAIRNGKQVYAMDYAENIALTSWNDTSLTFNLVYAVAKDAVHLLRITIGNDGLCQRARRSINLAGIN